MFLRKGRSETDEAPHRLGRRIREECELKEGAEMKRHITLAIAFVLFAASPAIAQSIEIMLNGSRPSTKGAPQNFTGTAIVDPLFASDRLANVSAGHVTFEPGARSAWHTHPKGQFLVVTSGTGWVQEWGGEKREIKPGDVVWIAPGVKHWHGATVRNAMRHVAIQETVDGKNVDWLEQVSDEQYGARP
jgi:quercetin dioxygenase-like cupin family protein